MARTPEQLAGWALLLELCLDDCEVFRTHKAMREAVIEVEKELSRLHEIENAAIRLTQYLERCARTKTDDDAWWKAMDAFWNSEDEIRKEIVALIPEAFTDAALAAAEPHVGDG